MTDRFNAKKGSYSILIWRPLQKQELSRGNDSDLSTTGALLPQLHQCNKGHYHDLVKFCPCFRCDLGLFTRFNDIRLPHHVVSGRWCTVNAAPRRLKKTKNKKKTIMTIVGQHQIMQGQSQVSRLGRCWSVTARYVQGLRRSQVLRPQCGPGRNRSRYDVNTFEGVSARQVKVYPAYPSRACDAPHSHGSLCKAGNYTSG